MLIFEEKKIIKKYNMPTILRYCDSRVKFLRYTTLYYPKPLNPYMPIMNLKVHTKSNLNFEIMEYYHLLIE